MREAERFVEELRQEGALESEGAFTIDSERAQRILGLHLLSDSRHWVLKLIQWAVALSAANIELSLAPHSVRIRHDGNSLEPGPPSLPLSTAGNGDEDWARRELAVALQVVAQLHPHSVSLVQAYEEEAWMQRFEARSGTMLEVERISLAEWPWPGGLEQTVLGVDLAVPLSTEDIGWMREEIARRTPFCPANVTLPGSFLERQDPVAISALAVAELASGWSPWSIGLRANADKTFDGADGRGLESGFFPVSSISCLNPPSRSSGRFMPPGVHFVHLGVLLDPFPWQEVARRSNQSWMCDNPGFGRLCFVRSTHGLTLDAAGESLVLDAGSARVLNQLTRARRQLQKVLQHVDPALQLTF